MTHLWFGRARVEDEQFFSQRLYLEIQMAKREETNIVNLTKRSPRSVDQILIEGMKRDVNI